LRRQEARQRDTGIWIGGCVIWCLCASVTHTVLLNAQCFRSVAVLCWTSAAFGCLGFALSTTTAAPTKIFSIIFKAVFKRDRQARTIMGEWLQTRGNVLISLERAISAGKFVMVYAGVLLFLPLFALLTLVGVITKVVYIA
jgi:hypothetical protein